MHLILLDVDGTLLDNKHADDACYVRAFQAALGVGEIETDWGRYPHATDSCITRGVLESHYGRPATDDEMAAVRAAYVAELERAFAAGEATAAPTRGAAAMLAQLGNEGRRVAIATGGWRVSAMTKLMHARLDVRGLPAAFADDHVTREGILEMARKRAETAARRTATRVVYVGDAVWDVKAAASLRLPFVGVARGERAQRLTAAGAGQVVCDFADLAGFTRALDAARPPG